MTARKTLNYSCGMNDKPETLRASFVDKDQPARNPILYGRVDNSWSVLPTGVGFRRRVRGVATALTDGEAIR